MSSEDDYDLSAYVDLVSSWRNQPTAFLSRYYTLHFHSNDHLYVRQAPNKVCVIGITEHHDALKHVPLRVVPKLQPGKFVKPDTVICELVANDGSDMVYQVKANLQGKLLEFNPRLLEGTSTDPEPQLLWQLPMTEGYLAIFTSMREDSAVQLSRFVSQQEYFQSRINSKESTSSS